MVWSIFCYDRIIIFDECIDFSNGEWVNHSPEKVIWWNLKTYSQITNDTIKEQDKCLEYEISHRSNQIQIGGCHLHWICLSWHMLMSNWLHSSKVNGRFRLVPHHKEELSKGSRRYRHEESEVKMNSLDQSFNALDDHSRLLLSIMMILHFIACYPISLFVRIVQLSVL